MGKASRDKGARRERELVKLFESWGLGAERVPLSGAAGGAFAGDVVVYPSPGAAPHLIECKARANGFKTLHDWLAHDGADILALRADNKDWLFVVPQRIMQQLLKGL